MKNMMICVYVSEKWQLLGALELAPCTFNRNASLTVQIFLCKLNRIPILEHKVLSANYLVKDTI